MFSMNKIKTIGSTRSLASFDSPGPEVIKHFSRSTEHEIFSANKYENANNSLAGHISYLAELRMKKFYNLGAWTPFIYRNTRFSDETEIPCVNRPQCNWETK